MTTKYCKKCRQDRDEQLFVTLEGKPAACCSFCLEKNRKYRREWSKLACSGLGCQGCGKLAPEGGFPITRFRKPGKKCERCLQKDRRYYLKNKEQLRAKQKVYYHTPKGQEIWGKANRERMERFYGLESGQKDRMYENQKGICGICEVFFPSLAVDHNHVTGEIRELLCRPCNLGLGNFRENTNSLEKAILYLARWNPKP